MVVLDQTKANHRRVNPIPKNALEWLKLVRGTGKLTPSNHAGRMRYIRKASKAGCKQNSARIGFASHHVAMYEDAAKTSLLLGHKNPSLLWETYRALVSKEEAKRYWRVTPNYDGKGEIGEQPSEEEIARNRGKRLAAALAEDRSRRHDRMISMMVASRRKNLIGANRSRQPVPEPLPNRSQ